MSEASIGSDKGLGIGLALIAATVVGVVLMYGGAAQIDRAWGFAAAMVGSILAVVAFQLFE